jgi:hypothetical protein
MNINLDTVPRNLDEAVDIIVNALDDSEKQEMSKPGGLAGMHFGFGMWLRNNWSLWHPETILVQWFKKNLGIVHGDDLSGTILTATASRLRGEQFDANKHVEVYKKHWRKYGLDPATMEKL